MSESGILVVNKPRGPTSHDVVAAARRLFGTRAVGHAGTLDPMATGVMVLLVGEATKLSSYLTADDKDYRATVRFGRATDTLDADGTVVAEAALSEDWLDEGRLRPALAAEAARELQVPPAFSAISVDGVRSHRRARRGAEVTLPPRAVRVASVELRAIAGLSAVVDLRVSKGFYVRAFARDLGERLGVPAHLEALERRSSGPFRLDEACPWPPETTPALTPLADAVRRALPVATLTDEGSRRARLGQPLADEHFVDGPAPSAAAGWFSAHGTLVALGSGEAPGAYRVLRGFKFAQQQ